VAKPDTDDGWFKFAVELETALAYAAFSKVARVLLSYVFLQIYGKGIRPKLAYLPQKETALRIRQKRPAVNRAIRELVDSGVLVEIRDDQYRFIKDYEKWTSWSRDKDRRGSPRLTPGEVDDCKGMPAFAESFRVKADADPSDPSDNQVVNKSITSGLSSDNQVVNKSAGATIGTHARNLDLREREDRGGEKSPPGKFSLPGNGEKTADRRAADRMREEVEAYVKANGLDARGIKK
jgi:hypothetical protein